MKFKCFKSLIFLT